MSKQKRAKWPGVDARLTEAMEAAGYWKQGRPDVMRFALQNGFHPAYIYRYLAGEAVPDRDNLFRLAELLHVDPKWLLFGDDPRPAVPVTGASAAAQPLPVGKEAPVVAQGRPATPSIAGRAETRDTLSGEMSLIRRAKPRPWGSMKVLTQLLAFEIRRQMLLDRLGLRAA